MQTIQSSNYNIEIGALSDSTFGLILDSKFKNSKKIILVDENTKEYCLEYLITTFTGLANAEVIELPSGEENKQLEICIQVWESLTEYQIDRNALIVNLGGGVISDMGGLIASLYKRGIAFINIPTTLLAMVDASVGGKTGVDLGIYKNQIGTFSFPEVVYIDTGFLHSLPDFQIKNGIAEMIKHGLIQDRVHWDKIKSILLNQDIISDDLILQSVSIKNQIVLLDPYDKLERKKLNFGHTIGHAIESYFLGINKPITHGFAVAAGILIESFISFKKNLLSENEFNEITKFITQFFSRLTIPIDAFQQILINTKQDKKNSDGEVKMVLLKNIGESIVDISVEDELILNGLKYYIENYFFVE